MDRVHILLKQAHEYYDHWQKTVKEIQKAQEGLREAQADPDQSVIQDYTELLALLRGEAAQDISMLKKCVEAAEKLASKLPPASTQNPGGEQGGWRTSLGWFTTGETSNERQGRLSFVQHGHGHPVL